MLRRTRTFFRRLTGSGEDRRAHPRHVTDVETTCRSLADDADMRAHIRNVSRAGVNLLVPRSVPEGTMVRVNLPGPAGAPQTTLLACVTNARDQGADGWSLGCMFSLELSEAEMQALGGEKTPAEPTDQRAWVRHPVQGTVEYRVLPDNDPVPDTAELVDLAPGGVGLIVGERLEPGTALTVTLRRKDHKPDRPMLVCVVYLAERPDAKWAVGCHFLHELSERELNELVWKTSA